MIKDYIESQLATRREELEAAELAMQIARQKVVDAEDQLAIQETRWRELQGRVQELEAVKAQVDANGGDKPKRRRSATTGRGMSDAWRNVLALMKEHRPNGANYEDIVQFGSVSGLELNKTNLRRHMSIYVEKGYVRRIGDGEFVLAPKGEEVATLTKQFRPPATFAPDPDAKPSRDLDEEIPF